MKLSGSILVLSAALGCAATAAPATGDFTRRNEALAPAATTQPVDRRQPADDVTALQARRVTFPTVDKPPAAVADRRAPIAVGETTPKKVLPPATAQLRAATRSPDLSPLNHQLASFSTDGARQPTLVAKYQDKISSAEGVTIGRTPSVARGAEARLNRFVFRHNGPATPPSPATARPIGAAPAETP